MRAPGVSIRWIAPHRMHNDLAPFIGQFEAHLARTYSRRRESARQATHCRPKRVHSVRTAYAPVTIVLKPLVRGRGDVCTRSLGRNKSVRNATRSATRARELKLTADEGCRNYLSLAERESAEQQPGVIRLRPDFSRNCALSRVFTSIELR